MFILCIFLITAKINDTVTFGEEEEDDIIEFDEVGGEEDIENVSLWNYISSCLSKL